MGKMSCFLHFYGPVFSIGQFSNSTSNHHRPNYIRSTFEHRPLTKSGQPIVPTPAQWGTSNNSLKPLPPIESFCKDPHTKVIGIYLSSTGLVRYVSRPELVTQQPQCFSAVLNSIVLAKCINAHLWENSPYVSKQLKGIGPTFSTLLASAGITNFTILEESHPRDLERVRKEAIIYPYVIL